MDEMDLLAVCHGELSSVERSTRRRMSVPSVETSFRAPVSCNASVSSSSRRSRTVVNLARNQYAIIHSRDRHRALDQLLSIQLVRACSPIAVRAFLYPDVCLLCSSLFDAVPPAARQSQSPFWRPVPHYC